MSHTVRWLSLVALFVVLPSAASAQTVGDRWGSIGTCSTGLVRSWALNDQIAQAHRCLGGVEIVRIEARTNLTLNRGTEWGHQQTRDAVYAAAESRSLQINTAYRTVLEQHALDQTCAGPAASPGNSNHETGTAVDIQQAGAARSALEGAGCDWPAITNDLVHYNCPPFGLPITSVEAFQRLWNLNNPSDTISVDNSFGPATRARLMASPIDGFASDGCGCEDECGCDDSAGGLTFSCDGAEPTGSCVELSEPADTDGWGDNYLCSERPLGLVWSNAGPLGGMRCEAISEAADMFASAWSDNYLCLPEDSAVELRWSDSGPVAGWSCVQFDEPDDSPAWADNYLCSRDVSCFEAGGFTFCQDGLPDAPPAGTTCEVLTEPADPDSWSDNHFCSSEPLGMVWSSDGAIEGMRCVAIDEPEDPEAAAWADNFLCFPEETPLDIVWSHSGPLGGYECVRWYEPSEAPAWEDNYLCVRDPGGAPTDAGSMAGIDADLPDGGRVGSGDSGPGGVGTLTSGCGCRVGGNRAQPGPLVLLAFATLLLNRRRRRR